MFVKTDLLGASMRMGALIPRYSLEALEDISTFIPMSQHLAYPSFFTILRKQSSIPLYASSPTAVPL